MSRFALNAGTHAVQSSGYDVATSSGTAITPGSAAWGAWTELVTSNATYTNKGAIVLKTPGDWNSNIEANYWFYLRFGIGASGSEQQIGDIIPILGTRGWSVILLDLEIPQGARISMSASGETTDVIETVPAFWYESACVQKIVTDSTYTVTGGPTAPTTAITNPTADNTWSAWTELLGSATDEADEIIIWTQTEGRTGGEGHEKKLFQIGKGVAGSETPVLTFARFNSSYQVELNVPFFALPIKVNQGDRISIRWQSDTWTAHTPYTTNAVFALRRFA